MRGNPAGQQVKGEEEQSLSKGPKSPNSSKPSPPESNQGEKLGGRVEVSLGHCPLDNFSVHIHSTVEIFR